MADEAADATNSGSTKAAGWAPKVFVAAGTIAAVSIGFGVWASTSPDNSESTQTSSSVSPDTDSDSQSSNQPSASPVLAVDPSEESNSSSDSPLVESGSGSAAGSLWPAPALHTGTPLVDQGNPLSSSGERAWSSPQDYANYEGGYPNAPIVSGSGSAGQGSQSNSAAGSGDQNGGTGSSSGDSGNGVGTDSNNGQGQGNGVDGNQGSGQGNVPATEEENVVPPANQVPVRPAPPADGILCIPNPKTEIFTMDPRTKQVVSFDEDLAMQGSKYPWVPDAEGQRRYDELSKGSWQWVPVELPGGVLELQSMWVGSEAEPSSEWIFPTPTSEKLIWGLSPKDREYALYMWEIWTAEGEPLTKPEEESPSEQPTSEELPVSNETEEVIAGPEETSAEEEIPAESEPVSGEVTPVEEPSDTEPEQPVTAEEETPAEEVIPAEEPSDAEPEQPVATEEETPAEEPTEGESEEEPTSTVGDQYPLCSDLVQPYEVDCLDGITIVIANPPIFDSGTVSAPLPPVEVLPVQPIPGEEHSNVPSCSAITEGYTGECLDEYGIIMVVGPQPSEETQETSTSTSDEQVAATDPAEDADAPVEDAATPVEDSGSQEDTASAAPSETASLEPATTAEV